MFNLPFDHYFIQSQNSTFLYCHLFLWIIMSCTVIFNAATKMEFYIGKQQLYLYTVYNTQYWIRRLCTISITICSIIKSGTTSHNTYIVAAFLLFLSVWLQSFHLTPSVKASPGVLGSVTSVFGHLCFFLPPLYLKTCYSGIENKQAKLKAKYLNSTHTKLFKRFQTYMQDLFFLVACIVLTATEFPLVFLKK